MRIFLSISTALLALGGATFSAQAEGAYGPDTCKQGYVWREAIPSDHVCVLPAMRSLVQTENKRAWKLRDPNGRYGSDSCKQGYVWREAFTGDRVCVTPQRRTQTQRQNAVAARRVAR